MGNIIIPISEKDLARASFYIFVISLFIARFLV